MQNMTGFRNQQGAALVVGLILMVVVTVLAISGMNTATTELAMARNDQSFEDAFQAAETGVEQALAQGSFEAFGGSTTSIGMTYGNETIAADILFEESTGIVPDKAFSIGTGISAHHFVVTSRAESRMNPGSPTDRDASATHTQAFYIVGAGTESTL